MQALWHVYDSPLQVWPGSSLLGAFYDRIRSPQSYRDFSPKVRADMHGKHHPEDKPDIKLKQRRWRIYSVLGTMLATFLVIGCIISKLLLVVRSHIARSINSSGFIGACGPSHKLDPSLPSLESLSTSGRAWESTTLLRGM